MVEIHANAEKLRVAHPYATQHATFSENSATMSATYAQPMNLKALCNIALERNRQRNSCATMPENMRNFDHPKQAEKLRTVAPVAREVAHLETGATDMQPTAETWVLRWTPKGKPLTVKAESQQHAKWIQRMNPRPDKAEIQPIGDEQPPTDQRTPPDTRQVRCIDCQHSKPTSHTALFGCSMGNQAPGAGSLWWGLDLHLCGEYEEGKP